MPEWSPAQPPGGPNYLPLVVGNSWSYSAPDSTIQTHEVTEQVNFGGVIYHKLDLSSDGYYEYFRVDSLGRIYQRPNQASPELLMFDVTREHDESYTYSSSGGVTFYFTVKRNVTVSVPGGTFTDCLQFDLYSFPFYPDAGASYMFAPDVGLVRYGGFWDNGDYVSGSVLLPPPPAPQLSSPGDLTVDLPFQLPLTWRSAPGAELYFLQVVADSGFTMPVAAASTADTAYTFSAPDCGATYYWRVTAKGRDLFSDYSPTWSFTTHTPGLPPSPAGLSPPDSATPGSTVQFSWAPTSGVEEYRIQLSSMQDFAVIDHDSITSDTVFSPAGLSGLYYWRVASANCAGQGEWSGPRTIYAGGVVCSLRSGWNIVSVPVRRPEYHYMQIFPDVGASPASYGSSGYFNSDILPPGNGFWLKHLSQGEIIVEGAPILSDTVDLDAGWHLLGAIGVPVAVEDLEFSPPDLPHSSLYGFDGGYFVADSLAPGQGYWIRTFAPGSVIIRQPEP